MIQQYINYIRNIRGYSENTCQAYENDLKDFVRWTKENIANARWSTITREHIDKYVCDLVSAELKPATTNRRLAAISGIYNYLRREGYEVENPCKYESRRKRTKSVPNTIPYKEMEKAYEYAGGHTKVMLGILMTTGIRIQELLDIRWEDINFEKCCIKIHGKGMKERVVWTLPEQLETLQRVHKMGHKAGLIFNETQRDARRMIFEALKPYSNAPQLSPHAIRHTFATHMAEEGVNCSTLAQMLGHQHLDTTQHYIDLGQSRAPQAFREHSILN